MKLKIMFVLISLLIIAGCKLTNPNNTDVNEAMLIIENYTEDTLFLTLDDGSLGPYPVHTLLPDNSYTETWESDDELFVLNNGQLILTYNDGMGNEESAIIQLSVGSTTYYTISVESSVLVIRNETNSDTWFSINDADLNFLFAGEISSITFGNLDFPTQIDLFYTGYHVFSNNIELTIYPFNTQGFDIIANAGAIKLENTSLSDLTEVYIAPSEDEYWGANVLNGLLEPEQSAYWTLESGWWDVRIIDEWGFYQDFLNIYIIIDDTDVLTFRSNNQMQEIEMISEKKFINKSNTSERSKKLEFKQMISN